VRLSLRSNASKVSIGLGIFGVLAGVYELVAIVTGAVPTISETLWFLPWPATAAIYGVFVLIGLDHFVTRKWL